ncbi:MAG: hypothetical protein V9G04_00110 [Nocardioides sp.]
MGRSATLATCSAPFSSAIRRRASFSTRLLKSPMRWWAARSASSSVSWPVRRSLDESVGEFGGAHSLQSGVRRPTRQAGTTSGHRAEARDRLDSQRVERLLITVSKRLLQSRTEVLEGGGVVA